MSQPESFDSSHAITIGGNVSGTTKRVLRVGDLVGGSYRLKSLLGRGGMGYVFCAEHELIKRDYALKILAPEQLNEASIRRFEIEGKAIAKLDHVNIVKVHNMGIDAGTCPFYVMDLLDGLSLDQYLSTDIALENCLDWFIQIAAGLGYAHEKGIVHRDVKPSNVVLLDDGRGGHLVKIVDFGIAKLLPSSDLHIQSQTATGEVFGSPLYMSPEQCLGNSIDHRTDIYSLGCSFFETLCGYPPFRGENAMATVMLHLEGDVPSILSSSTEKNFPPEVDVLFSKMVARAPENRYQSMRQIVHDIERVKEGKTIGGRLAVGQATVESSVSNLAVKAKGADFTAGDLVNAPTGSLATSGEVESSAIAPAKGRGALWFVYLVPVLIGGVAFFMFPSHHEVIVVPRTVGSSNGSLGEDFLKNAGSIAAKPDPEYQTASKYYDDLSRIDSDVEYHDGKDMLKINFPGWPIGLVGYNGSKGSEAISSFYAPINSKIFLETGGAFGKQVLRRPDVFNLIDPNIFFRLCITGQSHRAAQSEMAGHIPEGKALTQMLKAASHWTKLEELQINRLEVSRASLDLINAFKHLKMLQLERTDLNSSDLTCQPFLQRLAILHFVNFTDVKNLCPALGRSKKLQQLGFNECHLEAQDLRELKACSSMTILDLQQNELAKLVPAIMELKQLRDIRFRVGYLPVVTINAIAALPNIDCVQVSLKTYGPADLAMLRLNRKVKFLE